MGSKTPAETASRTKRGPDSTFVLQRRTGESLFMFAAGMQQSVEGAPVVPTFSGLVKITVVAVDGDEVTLAVTGPEELPVRAEEDSGPTG